MLSSVQTISASVVDILVYTEWGFTILFSIEYFLRIYLSNKPRNYIFSVWGIIDLLSTIPTYLTLFFHGTKYLLIIRVSAITYAYSGFFDLVTIAVRKQTGLGKALKASSKKITVFFGFILILVVLDGYRDVHHRRSTTRIRIES